MGLEQRSPAAMDGASGDQLGGQVTSTDSLTAAEKQRLSEMLVAYDSARLRVLIGDDDARALGIEPEDDLAGILTGRIVAIRLILCGRASIAELPGALPEGYTSAAIAWRQERVRRSGGRMPA